MRKIYNPESFRDNLRDILNKNRVKQAELARITGLTPACICQIISGKRDPSFSSVCKILNELGLRLEDLCSKERSWA